MNRSLLLLCVCQALFMTNNVTFIAINGLVGLRLAPQGWMATLPVMGYVVGSALAAGPVARLQSRWGRRRAFQMGLVVAALSAAGGALAVSLGSFWGVLAATVVAGFYNTNAQLYRFAGPELVAPEKKAQAISLVMAGGVAGAFIGPNLAHLTRDWLSAPFAGAYVALVGIALLGLVVISLVRFPPHQAPAPGSDTGRPVAELARQPEFVVAVVCAALAYGVMNLLMAATPLAMERCGLPFRDAALVIEWHVLGMFVPAFFTGHLIQRFGTLPVMAVGLALNLACVAVALSGVELERFLAALLLLGVGWNFLFTGATTLLTTTYRPQERMRAQGTMDFCVFTVTAVTAFASGALVTTQGWFLLNLGSLLPLLLMGLALGWLGLRPRLPQQTG
ncbi:MAG: MFS transporter [Piscinibacter sp.]|uniref:MFS transporter n=1 Tax=Piscinibacter TaxID=1114981 RepID=UPI000FDEB8CA|nr:MULTISPECIES: MFS transporter [Piscinibacter]MCW5666663.1 MFS transporter [Piscinibacter sp.]